MTISKLMADPKAAAIYASIGEHVPPLVLADNYLQAKLAGNSSECLAIECAVRDLARRYFHITEVRDALARVERHKTLRKPGTSAPKMLQEIADIIERRYTMGTFDTLEDGRIQFAVPVSDNGHLRVTCENMPGAVALVCAKYRRGIGKSRAARYGLDNA